MRCAICDKELGEEKGYMFFPKDISVIWVICPRCERLLNCITDPQRKRWVHLSIAFFEKQMESINDNRLRKELDMVIEKRRREIGMHIPYL